MSGKYVVALLRLAGTVDAAVAALPDELGTTAYELRLTLAGGFPAVVLVTTDGARAAASARTLEAKGHRTVCLDRADVTASSHMIDLRDFQLEPSNLVASAGGASMPFADIGVLIRATHRTTTTTVQEVKGRQLRPVMAVVTGGMILSKKVTKEVTSTTEQRHQVLYLFRRSGAAPWILRERGARYEGLGKDLQPIAVENFATTIRKLRQLAPHAAYDERLVGKRVVRGLADGTESVDLLAHLVAMTLAEPGTADFP